MLSYRQFGVGFDIANVFIPFSKHFAYILSHESLGMRLFYSLYPKIQFNKYYACHHRLT